MTYTVSYWSQFDPHTGCGIASDSLFPRECLQVRLQHFDVLAAAHVAAEVEVQCGWQAQRQALRGPEGAEPVPLSLHLGGGL